MFYVKRQREERAAGRPVLDAIETAAATSGRSVLISGLTVLLAMSGMFLTGSKIFYGIGQATMLVVAVAVIASLTLLPALLALLGDRVDRGRLPFAGRARRTAGQGRVWTAVLDRVLARPALTAALAVCALVVLALPVLRLHTATPGASDLPQHTAALQTYNRIQQVFPGGGSPAVVVVEAPDVTAPAVAAAGPGLRAGRAGQRPDERADHVHRQPGAHRRAHPGAAGRHRGGRGVGPRPGHAAGHGHPGHAGPGAGRPGRGDRGDGRHRRLQRADGPALRLGLRVRAAVRVRAAARLVPVPGHPGHRRAPQPAVGGRRLRRHRRALPVGLGAVAARLHQRALGRELAAAVPVRGAVRAVHGLPRVHPQPDQGELRPHRPDRRRP